MANDKDGKMGWLQYRPGPAMLVAAAFIGPGTVTTASLAGGKYGFTLLWALIFAIIGAIILQNMAGRIGIVKQRGLAEAILLQMPGTGTKFAMAGLILVALIIGNAAYEGGNLGGAVAGAQLILPASLQEKGPLIIGIALLAVTLFLFGGQRLLTWILTILVLVMSLAFIMAALSGGIDLSALGSALVPSLPDGSTLTAIALIGTTIVPYNLFLHAALARDKWQNLDTEAMSHAEKMMRQDTIFAISLGGLISIAILSTAATFVFAQSLNITSPADMALQIAPIAGDWAVPTIGIGLFSAGLTSAITAPMATALIVQELFKVFGEDKGYSVNLYRVTGVAIIMIGTTIAFADISLLAMIVAAQAANGLLLPMVAILLYRLAFASDDNQPTAKLSKRLPALLVIAITILLSGRQLYLVVEKLVAGQ